MAAVRGRSETQFVTTVSISQAAAALRPNLPRSPRQTAHEIQRRCNHVHAQQTLSALDSATNTLYRCSQWMLCRHLVSCRQTREHTPLRLILPPIDLIASFYAFLFVPLRHGDYLSTCNKSTIIFPSLLTCPEQIGICQKISSHLNSLPTAIVERANGRHWDSSIPIFHRPIGSYMFRIENILKSCHNSGQG